MILGLEVGLNENAINDKYIQARMMQGEREENLEKESSWKKIMKLIILCMQFYSFFR